MIPSLIPSIEQLETARTGALVRTSSSIVATSLQKSRSQMPDRPGTAADRCDYS
jgi:hypothetical protein